MALRIARVFGFRSTTYSRPGLPRGDDMKAIVQDVYGSADVLELRDIDRPSIGDAEVLVQVRAAGVDPGVWHLMTGLPYPIRLAGYGFSKVRFRGRDACFRGCRTGYVCRAGYFGGGRAG